MRTPLVAGNWKLNLTVAEACRLVADMLPGLGAVPGVEKVICPPFTALMAVSILLEGTEIDVGAQNVYWEASGAFTGETSPLMLREFCRYVILGHSERRAHFGETDAHVNRKIKAALAHGLTPIVCVGETLEENEAGRAAEIVSSQLVAGLSGVGAGEASGLVIAYEPVWAIGTGRAATPEGVAQVIRHVIRPILAGLASENLAQSIRVLYGGSVKPDNAAAFFREPEIDGALVGGASLDAGDFVRIAQAAHPG